MPQLANLGGVAHAAAFESDGLSRVRADVRRPPTPSLGPLFRAPRLRGRHPDIRGRGDSGGEYHYLYNAQHTEADDGYDAVEWLAAQSWCEAILRMRFRNGFEREELMEPGRVYAIGIELQPTANRFMPGHRIRIDISSSNFPLWDSNRNTGEPLGLERTSVAAHQTVFHDAVHPSHVVLPIVQP